METFTESKPFVDNPFYREQRDKSLASLDSNTVDAPIVEIVTNFAKLLHCFTLQSCYGHFLYDNKMDPRNVDPLTNLDKSLSVEYRIAYIALCIQNSGPGLRLFQKLKGLTGIDQEYIQFGCAEWFWERQVNSYVVQVEPERYKTWDKATVSSQEALYIEEVRNKFFDKFRRIIQEETNH